MSAYTGNEAAVIELDLIDQAISRQQEEKGVARLSKLQVAGLTGAVTSEQLKISYKPTTKLLNHLRLDFQNILKIDNLKAFKNLTKLQLDNNLIERIENLDSLTGLESLDLSFNRIKKIEGLSKLVKLSDLSLFQNNITIVEGLDALENLQILSIGNNKIAGFDNIKYLAKFKGLQSLNLAGNPVTSLTEYQSFTIACLSRLKFLDYKPLTAEEIAQAREKHEDIVADYSKREQLAEEAKSFTLKQNEEQEVIKVLNLEKTYQLLDLWISDVPELKAITCVAPDELAQHFEKIRPKTIELVNELKAYLIEQQDIRKLRLAEQIAILDAQKESVDVKCLEVIKNHKQELKKNEDIDLKTSFSGLYSILMNLEMSCYEKIDDSLAEFEQKYRQVLKETTDGIRARFQQVRVLAGEFHQSICEITDKSYEQLLQLNIDDVNEEAQALLLNQEHFSTLQNGIHEKFLAIADTLEENILAPITKEVDTNLSQLEIKEWTRNRDRVAEFKKYCEREFL